MIDTMEDVNFLLLQYWEVVESDGVCLSDGVSLHLDRLKRDLYLKQKYAKRNPKVIEKSYDRFIGDPIIVAVSDKLFSELEKYGTYKLREHEFNNLVNIGDIDLI